MTSLQIEYFFALARYKSFSLAADAMYVSQAAVSKQIAALESELQMTLFERRYRAVTLTKVGEIMLDYFQRAAEEYRKASEAAHQLDQQGRRSLRIGMLEGIDMGKFYRQAILFRGYNSGLHMSFVIGSMQQIIQDVLNGNLDLGFTVIDERATYPSLRVLPIFDMYPCIYFSRQHPLAGKEGLCCVDFQHEVFYAPMEKDDNLIQHYRGHIERSCGFSPVRIVCCSNLDSAVSALELGSGVALLYEDVMLRGPGRLDRVRCENRKSMNIVYRSRPDNPMVESFVRWLQPHITAAPAGRS